MSGGRFIYISYTRFGIGEQELCINYYQAYMGITRYTLSQNNGNLPLPFFAVITQLLSWIRFIIDFICILTGSPE